MIQNRKFVAVLDNVRSLLNVGSIFRTAEALGFQKIYLGGITPAPTDERHKRQMHKTALGAEEYLPWEKSRQTLKILKKLKSEGYYLIALELGSKSIKINQLKRLPSSCRKIALIVGNEVKGINKRYLEYCDKILEIPLSGKKESLNVAVAFGIGAFWLKNLQ
ncbi:MAG TPA: TrmH family RNA methyltransferase [Candidatus Paceibacterota bacterium]|nr:TrmH family RNA methyltransferase [Candidatus Paceibacterota bacterium]HOL53836.1 TrmH family RNA methyltransferase [Candidatus Paceibacterota bacterium]HON21878.1 TrmH family RNA methyltransferase [Candidatus Paceibacterota bacterium]HPP16901.1 TrmH family RNA methyltransferase [Candidatus Paceibacterota bacterium]HRU33457.1 TrmH family RNA methyltransferase [Candidatus Paceibacterota bacterium]